MSDWLVVTRLGRTFVTEPQTWPDCMFCNRTPMFSWTFQLECLIGNVIDIFEFVYRKVWVCCCAQALVFSLSPKFPNREVSSSNCFPPKKTLSKGCNLQEAFKWRMPGIWAPWITISFSLELDQLGMGCQSYTLKSTQNCKPLHVFRHIMMMSHDHMLCFFT